MDFFKGKLREGWIRADLHDLPQPMMDKWFPGNGGWIYFMSSESFATLEDKLAPLREIRGVDREQFEDAAQLYDLRTLNLQS